MPNSYKFSLIYLKEYLSCQYVEAQDRINVGIDIEYWEGRKFQCELTLKVLKTSQPYLFTDEELNS